MYLEEIVSRDVMRESKQSARPDSIAMTLRVGSRALPASQTRGEDTST